MFKKDLGLLRQWRSYLHLPEQTDLFINSLSLLNELIELLIGPRLLMFSVSQAFGINFPTAEWQQNATKDFVFSSFILLSFFFLVMEMEPRAMYRQGECCTIELHIHGPRRPKTSGRFRSGARRPVTQCTLLAWPWVSHIKETPQLPIVSFSCQIAGSLQASIWLQSKTIKLGTQLKSCVFLLFRSSEAGFPGGWS